MSHIGGTKFATHYDYDVGPIGILMWLFNKKPCPKCSGKVKRKRKVKLVKQRSNEGFGGSPAVYKVTHGFVCEDCGKYFTFNEVRDRSDKK